MILSFYRACIYLVFSFLYLGFISGCASGRVQSDSRLQANEIKPIKSLLIYERLESKYFNDQLRTGVSDTLIKSFASCGTSLVYLPHDPLELNMQKRISDKQAESRAAAVLSIIRTQGGALVTEGGNEADFEVMLRLKDVASGKEIWTARSKVAVLTGILFTNDKKSGERIGQNFFNLIKKDLPICN